MPLLTLKKGDKHVFNPYFNSLEFDCPCSQCIETKIDTDLVEKLTKFRETINSAVRVNSGYRCQYYQNELRLRGYETALGVSQHELGRAADIMREDSSTSGVELEKIARAVGFMAVGVGNSWIHVDLRADKERSWEYHR